LWNGCIEPFLGDIIPAQPQLGYRGDGVEDYEKSRRMYDGIMVRENPVEFRVDD